MNPQSPCCKRLSYDALNQIKKITDPLQGITSFAYDPNGNLLSVTDARNKLTSYTYNNMDRVETRTDPLLNVESFEYDLSGNLKKHTDRRGKVTSYSYDGLDRPRFSAFGETINGGTPSYESTIDYTFDAGNRLTQAVDSQSGTITRSYNDLTRIYSETTSQGTVTYTFDVAGRRASMTTTGQANVSYGYDDADRLTSITQAAASVGFGYDNADRRISLTLPNGVVVEYGYDDASQLTSISYARAGTLLGDLSYEYDAVGHRTKLGGSFARKVSRRVKKRLRIDRIGGHPPYKITIYRALKLRKRRTACRLLALGRKVNLSVLPVDGVRTLTGTRTGARPPWLPRLFAFNRRPSLIERIRFSSILENRPPRDMGGSR